MAKRRRYRRRGTVRVHRRSGFTFRKGIKYAIGLGPIAGIAIADITAQPNANGIRAALGHATSAYTGWDVNSNSFQPQNLAIGYVPLIGAWAFGKFSSRILR